MRRITIILSIVLFALGGCASIDPDTDPSDEVDDDTSQVEQAATAAHTVYVNFGGGTFTDCAACNLSASNRSWIVGTVFKKSSVTLGAAFANDPARRTSVLNYLRGRFALYNVEFTDQRPGSGNYTMLVLTPDDPRPDHLPELAGYSPIDCGNAGKSDIAFLWRVHRTVEYPQTIEKLAAHELGHSFGLEHVINNGADLMLRAGRTNASMFTTSQLEGASACAPGATTQNGPARLLASLGAKPAAPVDRSVPLWRYYSAGGTDHYYTVFRDDAVLYSFGYYLETTEGRAFATQEPGTTAVYEYISSSRVDHFYTIDANELGQGQGSYVYWGVRFFIFPSFQPGTVGLHQYWNGTDHFYTKVYAPGGFLGYHYERMIGFVYP